MAQVVGVMLTVQGELMLLGTGKRLIHTYNKYRRSAIQSIVSANQASGFSIVKWDGTGSASTVGHGLSAAPEIILTKRLNGVGDWYSFSVFANGGTTPANYFLKLNSSDAETLNTGSPPSVFAGTVPTATVFSVGTTLSGSSSDNYIAYCFTSISGFNKIGTYSGTGSSNPITGLGFSPNWVMIKATTATENWAIFDTSRGENVLYANAADAESAFSPFTFDSDGFTVPAASGMTNGSGQTYIYMAFKENLTPPTPIVIPAGEMAYMVVAGGASGGSNGGGGGAGGLRTSYGSLSGGGASAESNISLSSGTYTITIGGGGAETTVYQNAGTNGTATTISGNSTVNTVGGGGGGSNNNSPLTGGSGGGSGSGSGGPTGAAGTAGEGFAGGNGMAASHPYTGGGGGGTGAVGGGASSSAPGAGGAGLEMTITGAKVNYGGGGGGTGGTGVGYTGPGGSGGTGGGGAGGAYNSTGIAATVNTGGGGGASGDNTGVGGAGGSGVVILRMNTSDYSGSTTGSPTVTTVDSYTILTYTGSGTYVHS